MSEQTVPDRPVYFWQRDPRRAIRPKRPVYWSALGVVAISGLVAGVAIWQWEPVQALAVVSPIVTLWGVMARGFFGGDDAAGDASASTQPNPEVLNA